MRSLLLFMAPLLIIASVVGMAFAVLIFVKAETVLQENIGVTLFQAALDALLVAVVAGSGVYIGDEISRRR